MVERLRANVEQAAAHLARVEARQEELREAGVDTSATSPTSPASVNHTVESARGRLKFLEKDLAGWLDRHPEDV